MTVSVYLTGATPGQTIDLTANVHGPTDSKTGAYDWCCSSPLRVTVPKVECPIDIDNSNPHT